MRKITTLVIIFAACLLAIAAHAQGSGALVGKDTYTFITSGDTWKSPDSIGTLSNNFEYVVSGGPATLSGVISGCFRGGTCDTLDTNTSTSSTIRKLNSNSSTPVNAPYDYYQVVVSWTGGASVSIKVNRTGVVAKIGGGSTVPGPFTITGASQIAGVEGAAPATPTGSNVIMYAVTGLGWCYMRSDGVQHCGTVLTDNGVDTVTVPAGYKVVGPTNTGCGNVIYGFAGGWGMTTNGAISTLTFCTGGALALSLDVNGKANLAGVLNTYNGLNSAGLGLPIIVGSARAVSQVAAISATNLLASASTAQYRVTLSINCDSTSAAATVTPTIRWTDPASQAQSSSATAAACTALGSSSITNQVISFAAKTGTAITYETAIANTPTYDIRVILEQATTN